MNKKAQEETGIPVELIIVIAAFVVIGLVFAFAGSAVAKNVNEATCRDSVFARDKIGKDIGVTYVGTPLLCPSIEKSLSGSDEQITKGLADLTAKCWWMYGQGTVEDPFKEGNYGTNKCIICYKVAIKGDKYKITGDEFMKYMAETTYTYDKSTTGDPTLIPVSYLDYIQRYGAGQGGTVLFSDIKAPEAYAISYGAPSGTCGTWCNIAGGAGAVGGGAVALKAGLVICSAASAATLGAAAPVCYPWVVPLTAGGAIVGGVLGEWAGAKTIPTVVDMIKEKREKHTIFITPLKDANEGCPVKK